MSMPIDTLETFINFCESLRDMYVEWIADPLAPNDTMLEFTVDQFRTYCEDFFELRTFKTYATHPSCCLLRELYEKINVYLEVTDIDFKDPRWIAIQKLAGKTAKALTTLIREKRPHE